MSQVADLQRRFENLVNEITEVLSEKEMECMHIINHLLDTPPENIGEHFTVVFKNMMEIPSNVTINEFMNELNKYMQFLDYRLLKEMVSLFASDHHLDLLNKVKNYEMDVVSLCQTIPISSLAESHYLLCSNSEDVPDNFTPMQVRYKFDLDECTLDDLRKMQKKLSEQLGIGFTPAYIQNAMILFKVELAKDCQHITWIIPKEIAPHLMMAEKAGPSFLRDQKIAEISFDTQRSDTSGSTSPIGSSKHPPSRYC